MNDELRAKLAKATGSMVNPKKDREGYGYMYAGLDSVIDKVRIALSLQGLSVRQSIARSEDGWELVTIVYGADGEAELDRRPVWLGADMQKSGSSETYARRYALLSCFGLAGVDDDDGAATKNATQPNPKRKNKPSRHKQFVGRIEQLEQQFIELGGNDGALRKYLKATYGTDNLNELSDTKLIKYGHYCREMVDQINEQLHHANDKKKDKK